MPVNPSVALYTLTGGGGLVLAQMLPPDGSGIGLGQGAGTGAFVGSVAAMVITAVGTNILRPWLEARGDRRKAEQLEIDVKSNTERINALTEAAARREMVLDAERNGFLSRVSDLTEKLGNISHENARLVHHVLVLGGTQKPGDIDSHIFEAIGDAPPTQDGPRVLLIEDAPSARDALTLYLARKGFAVEAVETLAEGMDALRRKPDYVVLDLKLPDGSGVDLLKKVQAEGLKTKVIVVTGASEPELIAAAKALAPYRYFTKPYDFFGDLLPALGWKSSA